VAAKNCWRRRFLYGPCRIKGKQAISSFRNFLYFISLLIKRSVYHVAASLLLLKWQHQLCGVLEKCPCSNFSYALKKSDGLFWFGIYILRNGFFLVLSSVTVVDLLFTYFRYKLHIIAKPKTPLQTLYSTKLLRITERHCQS
jgi:hypothetical protein